MEYKRNETTVSGVKDDMTGSYWLHTLEPKYEYNLPDGSLTLTLPVEYISYSYPMRGIKTHKVMFSPMLDIDYKLNTMASVDASVGIIRNADTRSVPFYGAIMNNYRTYTLGTDSMSFSRTKLPAYGCHGSTQPQCCHGMCMPFGSRLIKTVISVIFTQAT